MKLDFHVPSRKYNRLRMHLNGMERYRTESCDEAITVSGERLLVFLRWKNKVGYPRLPVSQNKTISLDFSPPSRTALQVTDQNTPLVSIRSDKGRKRRNKVEQPEQHENKVYPYR